MRLARDPGFRAAAEDDRAISAFQMGEPPMARDDKKLAGGGPLMDLGVYLIQAVCMAARWRSRRPR
jgi:predicted dehydrogenase